MKKWIRRMFGVRARRIRSVVSSVFRRRSSKVTTPSIPIPTASSSVVNANVIPFGKNITPTISLRKFWRWVILVYLALLNIMKYSAISIESETFVLFGEEISITLLSFYTLCLYTLLSFRTIGPKKIGARLLFGKPINNLNSGLVFVPLGACQLVLGPKDIIQDELPAEPEKIFRGDGQVPTGLFPPIRITFTGEKRGESKINAGKNLLRKQLTTEVVPVIRWRIADFCCFLQTIGDEKKAREQMHDITVGYLTSDLSQFSVAYVLAHLQEFSEKLQNAVNRRVIGWGIVLDSAQIKSIPFTHTLNDTIQSIPIAVGAATVKITNAEAEKTANAHIGSGEGQAERARLDGRTAGLLMMLRELGLPPEAVLGAETARALVKGQGSQTVVVGTAGFTELVGIAAAVANTLSPNGGRPTTSPVSAPATP